MREPDSERAQGHVGQRKDKNGSAVKTKEASESRHQVEDPYGLVRLLG